MSTPALSVVVVPLGGEGDLQRCLRALTSMGDIEVLVAEGESPASARAAAVKRARGTIVALTEDHCVPAPDWAEQILKAHRERHAAVGGCIDKLEPDTALDWAIYLADYLRYAPPMAAGPVEHLSDCNVSYKREALDRIADLWSVEFHENVVHDALRKGGGTLWLARTVVVRQKRRFTGAGALRDRYKFGRIFASTRVGSWSTRRLILLASTVVLPALLVSRVAMQVVGKRAVCRSFYSGVFMAGAVVHVLGRRGIRGVFDGARVNWRGIEVRCPHCRGDFDGDATSLRCEGCGRTYPVELGIPDLRVFPDPYIDIESDRAKGLDLASRFDDLDFAGLVHYYYRVTPAVTPKQARMFTDGVLHAPARAEAALDAWDGMLGGQASGSLLEIGSGTAPLLAVARRRHESVVGVDISLRWSVVGKKRLEEAGAEIPILCACAEALPFPDGSFDRIAMESTLEMVRDQRATLAECRRVLRPGGAVMIFTANRNSVGPDPHLGLWCGGMLPESWTSAYVRRRGGIPPVRHLVDGGELRRLLAAAGFRDIRVALPGISPAQRAGLPGVLRGMSGVYEFARSIPLASAILRAIGPAFHAVAVR